MDETCIFCKIAAGDIPVHAVYENEEFISFPDMHPQAPVHVLVIPRGHYPTLYDAPDDAFLGRALRAAGEAASRLNVAESGFRLVLNSGPDGGQEVQHMHFHLLGGRYLGWPPG